MIRQIFGCLFWHKWSKWIQYEVEQTVTDNTKTMISFQRYQRQRRTCECCGTVQDDVAGGRV